ncbi:hypothetical protein PUN28_010711 [Cardiocondyla obscurior]|uniref:Uncharacterized protein n=1 Tax=Cardiocondyla obscurior TaxID=286306 RepID=A0AAW2FMH5_9HYME
MGANAFHATLWHPTRKLIINVRVRSAQEKERASGRVGSSGLPFGGCQLDARLPSMRPRGSGPRARARARLRRAYECRACLRRGFYFRSTRTELFVCSLSWLARLQGAALIIDIFAAD